MRIRKNVEKYDPNIRLVILHMKNEIASRTRWSKRTNHQPDVESSLEDFGIFKRRYAYRWIIRQWSNLQIFPEDCRVPIVSAWLQNSPSIVQKIIQNNYIHKEKQINLLRKPWKRTKKRRTKLLNIMENPKFYIQVWKIPRQQPGRLIQ